MISLTFGEFAKGEYPDDMSEPYVMYIISNGGATPLYVGISTLNVWNRWFSARKCHMLDMHDGQWLGMSRIGQLVADNIPGSLAWRVELLTQKDCQARLEEEIKLSTFVRFGLHTLESMMIKKLQPSVNVVG